MDTTPHYTVHESGIWKFRAYRKIEAEYPEASKELGSTHFQDFTLTFTCPMTNSEALREAWNHLRDPWGHEPHEWSKVIIEARP